VRRLTIEFVSKSFMSEGYKLLSTFYKNSKQKLDYICPKGHKNSMSWNSWSNGSRCPTCAGLSKPDIEYVRKSFEKEGYTLISGSYINAKSKLIYKCDKGHISSTTWSNWTNKDRPRRCIYCAGLNKKSVLSISKSINEENYELKTNYYINAKSKLHLVCPNGHDYFVSWDNWFTKNNRCPKCNLVGVSRSEIDLRNEVINIVGNNIEFNVRNVIGSYELDIYVPDIKLAIEYCGLYWHSDLFKNKFYHLNKLKLCNDKGIKLITVFEDELLSNKSIVVSRLKDIIGSNISTILYARKCSVKEINHSKSKEFCLKNHLQGYVSSSIKLGLFYDNELISVMTFSKPSISKGSRSRDGVYELNRFCSKINTRVVGAASKLLKYFERHYYWKEIFSYADRRWSDGNLYRKLGFEFESITKPNYWYFKNNSRIHRFNLRKNEFDPLGFTEFELRKSQGYYKIWDCGNLKFKKVNNG